MPKIREEIIEEAYFKLLTSEEILSQNLLIDKRKKNLEVRRANEEANELTGIGKLVNGKIIYEIKEEFDKVDPNLEDGNTIPEKYGHIDKDLLNKPLVELGKNYPIPVFYKKKIS